LVLPSDLLTIGDVAQFEYECLAPLRQRFSPLPEFKEISPKYSLTIGCSDTKDLAPPA
jgi:hypothetical protein